jgi:hypothetical protein
LVSTDVHRDVYDVSGNSLRPPMRGEFLLTFMLWTNGGGQPDMRVLTWQGNHRHHDRRLAEWTQRVIALWGPLIDINLLETTHTLSQGSAHYC